MDPVIVLFGLGVGLLVGMTGIGGGSLMTPLLILVLGTKPIVAVGTDLAYGAITKTVGGWRHLRQGTVDLGISWWLAAGSIPGALGGVYVLERIHDAYGAGFDVLLLQFVAGALLLCGAATLGRALFLPGLAEKERDTVDLQARHKAAAIAIGLGVGFVLGVTSAGSGALIAIGLILAFRLTPRRVVGTDVFHAAVLLWVAALAHVASGNVDFGLAANILIGSVPGVWIGSSISVSLPVAALRTALGIVLLAAGLGVLSKAGVEVPPAALVLTPTVLAVGSWLYTRGRSVTSAPPGPPATAGAAD